MARASKRKPVVKPGKRKWLTVSFVNCTNGNPVYLQTSDDDRVCYRAVYLCDTRLHAISFWSADRNMDVDESGDYAMVLRAALTAGVPLTKTVPATAETTDSNEEETT